MFKARAGTKNNPAFRVYRQHPDSRQNPRMDTYELDMDKWSDRWCWMRRSKIKNEMDATLSLRRSCREGICGSCAMNIDGTNRSGVYQRHQDIKGDANIYPLPHTASYQATRCLYLTYFYAQYASIKSRGSAPSRHRRTGSACNPSIRARRNLTALRRHSCACCVHCLSELSGGNLRALTWGQLILLQAYRWIADSRDEAQR